MTENRKHAHSKDVIVAQFAFILECCRGGCGTYREETQRLINWMVWENQQSLRECIW